MQNYVNIIIFILAGVITSTGQGNVVPILDYNVDVNGQVELSIESRNDKYYILKTKGFDTEDFSIPTSMALGNGGVIILTENVSALPLEAYQIEEFDINNPGDIDGDERDDVFEFEQLGQYSPFNAGKVVDPINGVLTIKDRSTYKELSYKGEDGLFNENLHNVELVKFYAFDVDTDEPALYFMNTEKHKLHSQFATSEDLGGWQGSGQLPGRVKGYLIFESNVISTNGTLGTFRYGFGPNATYDFEIVRKIQNLLVANLPFIKNNLCYYPTDATLTSYIEEKDKFDQTRICILSEDDLLADVDYQAMHISEGFGFLKVSDIFETPNPRDIVIFEGLPNELSRVGGILTTVPQTPLSHVNLRAIQDNVPNAFIRNAVTDERVAPLIGKYVYYKTEQTDFTIREATVDEVNEWYESIRPTEEQIPPLNQDYTDILPLDDIGFDMADGFGAKSANLATMLTFGFPDYVIPSGYGVPFYYYQEFMRHNDFFKEAEDMINSEEFKSDLAMREEMLEDFRSTIKDGEMPTWMWDDLTQLQEQFPEGISIRCRSSTNNEDLPGFIGAGLYSSKTQHPDEGHISKSIKQVYASIWNLRAFEERDFYRINHYIASMGVLCHANFNNEQANGVGVSIDPIYQTEGTFYLNNQIGEDLITNPQGSLPEEILLDRNPVTEDDYVVIRYSTATDNQLLFTEDQLDEMREYLIAIHDNFKALYKPTEEQRFAMEIEYKITEEGDLSIKQARPWAGFWSTDFSSSTEEEEVTTTKTILAPNPISEFSRLSYEAPKAGDYNLAIHSVSGQKVILEEKRTLVSGKNTIFLKNNLDKLEKGLYFLSISHSNAPRTTLQTVSFVKI